ELSLTFVYPNDVKIAQVAAWKAAAVARAQKVNEQALLTAQEAQHCQGSVNNHYALQGLSSADWNLLPTREVCDDGQNTYFHFPGNMSIPLIYVGPTDKSDVLADYTFNSVTRVATVHQLAPDFHLRGGADGNALLCVHNKKYDPV